MRAWLLAAVLLTLPCQGQPDSPEAEADRPTALIVLDGKVLFRVRGVASYRPSSERKRSPAVSKRPLPTLQFRPIHYG
jgi:hypothetical protein